MSTSRRNLTIFHLGRNILFRKEPNLTIKIYSKFKIKVLKNNQKLFLAPKSINYSNYVLKRNFCGKAVKKSDKKDYNRHSYDEKIEKLINEQITVEYEAAYAYFSMALFYGRSNVALPGCHGFFMKMYYEELQHALDFAKYQLLRGGTVALKPINPPEGSEYADVCDSFYLALELEKTVTEALQELIKQASNVGDTDVQNMLDGSIAHQQQSICELARLLTRASELSGTDLGRYLFDRELHETHVRGDPGQCKLDIGPKLYT